MFSRSWILVLLALSLAACASSTPASRMAVTKDGLAAPDLASIRVDEDITIAPLDKLEIQVFNVTELGGVYQVEPDGRIKLPLVGAISAEGHTVFEFAALLEEKLSESYLQNPLVTVRIADASGARFTAEGAIRSPGMHPVRGDLSLMQAIALSGGMAPDANPKAIIIFRTVDGQRRAARFDLNQIRAGNAEDPKIYGNDIIMVDGVGSNRSYDQVLRSLPLVGLFMAVF